MRRRNRFVEEPRLNRRQPAEAGRRSLLGQRDRSFAGHAGLLGDRLMREEVSGRQADAGARRARRDPDREDRIAAGIKEIFIEADAFEAERLHPDPRDRLLDGSTWTTTVRGCTLPCERPR